MPQEKEVYTMTQLDNEFFEEYKHLERLCSDMYSCQDGIRQYLEDMECQFSAGEKVVPNWMRDYRKLRGLRKRRNTLAHNVSEYQVCTERDIEDVKDFTNRILRRLDPLAMLNLYDLRNETPKARAESEAPDSSSSYRILRRLDPLAMLNLYDLRNETPKARAESEAPDSSSSYYGMSQRSVPRKKKKGGKLKRVILWILLLLTIYALVMLLSALLEQTPYSTFKWLLP